MITLSLLGLIRTKPFNYTISSLIYEFTTMPTNVFFKNHLNYLEEHNFKRTIQNKAVSPSSVTVFKNR